MPITLKVDQQARCKGKPRIGRSMAAGVVAIVVMSLPISAGAAVSNSDSVRVLHFFSRFESNTFSTAAGKPFTPSKSNPPRPGDQIEGTDLDYVGNHAEHARTWTASDHELCIFDGQGNPVCHAQVAIDGSMILAQTTLTNISASTTTSTFDITGGTGAFQGVTGTILVVNLTRSSETSSSNVTITLRRP